MTELYDAVNAAWDDFVAGRLRHRRPGEGIEAEELGRLAWSALTDNQKPEALHSALGAYTRRVRDEEHQRERDSKPFDLADLVLRTELGYSGEIANYDEAEEAEDELAVVVDDVLAQIPAVEVLNALRQALQLAIPTVLRRELALLRAAENEEDAGELAGGAVGTQGRADADH